MATDKANDDLYRRNVQQKLYERYSKSFESDVSRSDFSADQNTEQSVPKSSPYSIQNFILLGGAVAVFYSSDFLTVVTQDDRVRNIWFWIGTFFITIHVSIAIYFVFWLTFWKKLSSDEWEKIYPKAIPLATASLTIGAVCLTVSLWPVWGIFTPVILLIFGIGAVVLVAMLG